MIKKITLLTAIVSMTFAPSLWAQDDDMYFTPKKKTAEEKAQEAKQKAEQEKHYVGNTYYVGSNRNVDEYNRRHFKSSVDVLSNDTTSNVSDIIDFRAGDGSYPDSATIAKLDTITDYGFYNPDVYGEDDYVYSRQLGRFYAYADPWYRHHWYYDPWYWNYYGYYDPWVYSYCYGGYYDPYYWGWYDDWYYDYGWYGYWGYNDYFVGPLLIDGGRGRHGNFYAGNVNGTQGHGYVRPHSDYASSNARRYSGSTGRDVASATTHAVSRGVSSTSRSENSSAMRHSAISRSGSFSGNRSNSYNSYNNNYTSHSSSNNFSSNSSYSSGSSTSGGYSGGGGGHSSGGSSGGGHSGGGFGGRR